MTLIPDSTTASLWIDTASLPNTKPYGLSSSPDGSTLYVGMVGSTGTSSLISIDVSTGTATTIDSGYTFIRHGVTTDDDGNVYFCSGINGGGTSPPDDDLLVWDGTSVSVQFPASNGYNYWGLEWDSEQSRIYSIWYPNEGARLNSYTLDGTRQTLTRPTSDPFKQHRPIATSDSYVMAGDADTGGADVWLKHDLLNDNTMAGWVRKALGFEITGLHAVSDTEFYALSQAGYVYRYDPTTDTSTALTTGLPVDTSGSGSDSGYGDLHITARNRCFVTRGGWNADRGNIGPHDQVRGSDYGIYEIQTKTLRPVVGYIGLG